MAYHVAAGARSAEGLKTVESIKSTRSKSHPPRSICSGPEGRHHIHWLAPIVADAEAGFGGPLNVFELIKSMIEAGAAGVHFASAAESWVPNLSRFAFLRRFRRRQVRKIGVF
jgi:isocitrate lyase